VAGYVRQDTGDNIASGKVANASDIDNEFDALVTAFDETSGHTHDGTSAEGAPITVIGPVQEYTGDGTSFSPKLDDTYSLGTAALGWSDLYVTTLKKRTSGAAVFVEDELRFSGVGAGEFGTLSCSNGIRISADYDDNSGAGDSVVRIATDGADVLEVGNAGGLNFGVGAATGGANALRMNNSGDDFFLRPTDGAGGYDSNSQLWFDYSATAWKSNPDFFALSDLTVGESGTADVNVNILGNSTAQIIFDNQGIIRYTYSSGLMTIGQSGNGGINISGAGDVTLQNDVTATSGLTVGDTGTTDIDLNILSNGTSDINFGDAADADVGRIRYDHTSNDMFFGVNGSNAMTIDSAGNIGIGVVAPSSQLEVANILGDATLGITGVSTASSILKMGDNIDDDIGKITYDNTADEMIITAGTNDVFKVTSSGVEITGTSVQTSGAQFGDLSSTGLTTGTDDGVFIAAAGRVAMSDTGLSSLLIRRQGSDGNVAVFYNETSAVGSISVSGSNTAFNTSSDRALKNSIVDAPSFKETLKSAKVREFEFNDRPGKKEVGFVAQEIAEVFPTAYTPAEGDTPAMIDYSKIVPYLVKTIQELTEEVEQLKKGK